MTVTISSTTDTEADVQAAVGHTATEADPPPTPEDVAPVEETVAATPETDVVDDALPEDEGTPEPVKAAGELVEDDDDGEPSEPEVAETDDSEEVVEAAPEELPKKKRRRRGRSYKERASQLAREKATESARADALLEELDALRAQRETPPLPAERPDLTTETDTPDATTRPDQSKFETYEAFQEALVDWKVSQRLSAHEREQSARVEAERKQQGRREAVAAHTARIDAFREAHPDFDTVIEQAKDLPVTPPMQDTVLHSEHGPALMYHLCQNPEECDRIAQMHPRDAIKEIGRLEAQLDVAQTTGPTPKAEPVTKAPRPIKPVGGGVTASTVPLDQMNYQDYKRARERQIALEAGLPDPYAGVRR